MQNSRGFSLLEILITSVLMALVIGLVTFSFKSLMKTSDSTQNRAAVGANLTMTLRFIQKVGRASQLCRKASVGGLDALDCDVDFSRPSDGTLEWIRFVVVGTNLEFQKDPNNDGNFTATRTTLQYPGVSEFTVCDDTNFSASTCDIEPTSISAFHTTYLLPGKANRFFRFRIKSIPISIEGQSSLVAVAQQGAFYRRNPTPFAPIVFQW